MIRKFLLPILLLLFVYPSFSQVANIKPISRIHDIQVLHLESELEGLQRMQPIYSKARGVTIFAAINNVNKRALRKLKMEATMLGADAVYITNNYQKGVQFAAPVQVAYSGVAYVEQPLTIEKINSITSGKTYHGRLKTTYNRNAFSEKEKLLFDPQQKLTIEDVYEERGKLWVDLLVEKIKRPYMVVRVSENQVILARVLNQDKVIENIELVSTDIAPANEKKESKVLKEVFPFLGN